MKTLKKAPEKMYIINDNLIEYRATAYALMKRYNLTEVKNINGNIYTIEEIEKSMI